MVQSLEKGPPYLGIEPLTLKIETLFPIIEPYPIKIEPSSEICSQVQRKEPPIQMTELLIQRIEPYSRQIQLNNIKLNKKYKIFYYLWLTLREKVTTIGLIIS
jgi:hypothetical protein